ncbi:peroxiredoxin IIF [Artemisia annua]|uniref:Peroxiredoxin IIF n=1 Tax=Artemisia annua TaxID=35608 RepID=A0A2U1Q2W5_ARTAN|nr:peroxiredoxin IIF [Artemisia annua]
MAYAMLKQRTSAMKSIGQTWRHFASLSVGADLVAAAPNVSLQKARTWDEGVSSKFSVTPLSDIFKGKKVVIFGLPVLGGCRSFLSLAYFAKSNFVDSCIKRTSKPKLKSSSSCSDSIFSLLQKLPHNTVPHWLTLTHLSCHPSHAFT